MEVAAPGRAYIVSDFVDYMRREPGWSEATGYLDDFDDLSVAIERLRDLGDPVLD